jgi:hypothetical protein
VNDNRREIWGADAITKFMDKEFAGDRITMEVRELVDNYGDIIVRASFWGPAAGLGSMAERRDGRRARTQRLTFQAVPFQCKIKAPDPS